MTLADLAEIKDPIDLKIALRQAVHSSRMWDAEPELAELLRDLILENQELRGKMEAIISLLKLEERLDRMAAEIAKSDPPLARQPRSIL